MTVLMPTSALQTKTFSFLRQLAANNNREWFAENKAGYLAAKADAEAFTAGLIAETAHFDPPVAGADPRKCLFRIYRDTRFSKDKTPYKTNMGIWLSPGSGLPGYYLNIAPGASFLAGGYWMPSADELKLIRQEIDYNSAELKTLLAKPSFKKYFNGLNTEHRLKTAPQGYPKDHAEIEFLRLKSFTVSAPLDDKSLTGDNALQEVVRGWKALYPLNQFLRAALEG